jgi:hypothetical protein
MKIILTIIASTILCVVGTIIFGEKFMDIDPMRRIIGVIFFIVAGQFIAFAIVEKQIEEVKDFKNEKTRTNKRTRFN